MRTENETIDNKISMNVRGILRVLVESQVNDQVEARIAIQVWGKIRDQVGDQVWTRIKENIEL
jgi:hypothetical protein